MSDILNISDIGEFVILSANEPYLKVSSINGFTENIVTESSDVSKEFRWSIDGISFSEWYDLNLTNLQTYIIEDYYNSFWVEYKYTLNAPGETSISNVNLTVTYLDESSIGTYPYPIAYGREKGHNQYPLTVRPFSWNPYAQNASIKLYKDLSNIVTQIHGHQVSYLRATPNVESRDVILGEWTLYNFEEPQCLKVIVPDNNFPDNKFNHTPTGIEFEPFEVHLDKRTFEQLYGNATGPQKLDALYFPLMDRMFQVSSTQLIKGYMSTPIYWKLSLVKYQKQASVIQSSVIEEQIDNLTTGIEELLGKEIQETKDDVTNTQQTNIKTLNNDPVREFVEKINNLIVQATIENNYTIISQYHYNLNLLYLERGYITAIRYKVLDTITDTSNRVYSCWFKEVSISGITKVVNNCQLNGNNLKVNFKSAIPNIRIGDYLKLYKNNNLNFIIFGKVTEINADPSKLYVIIEVDDYIIENADAVLPSWKNDSNVIGTITARRNLLWNYNSLTMKGIIIDLFESKYLKITLNSIEYWNILTTPLEDKWYGIILNVLNKFNQIGIHIYEIESPANKTTILKSKFKYIINNLPSENRTSGLKYEIISSPLRITNIRILNEVIEEEHHSIFLNQNIITDASHAILIDNAIPRLRLPYIGATK